MYRILVADSLPAQILQQYQKDGFEIDNQSGISREDLIEKLPQYDGLVVRSRTKVTAEVLQAGSKLKVIGRAGAGVDNIDTAEATRRGIIVMNTPGGNTIAATEHTIALLLAMLRNISPAHSSMLEQRWDRKTYLGHEIYGKTIGIVGLGKIGREVAKRLAAFDAKLIGYDPIMTRDVADRLGIELVDLDELLKRSDIISIHAPKMPETIDMLNRDNLATCKPGAVIVNCARGGIINEKALVEALDNGPLAAVAVDVYSSEPPTEWDLAKHPKVLATPHLGASTEEAQTKVAGQVLEQMITYFSEGVALNAVNFISVDPKIQPVVAPFFELGHRIGLMASQLRDGRLKEVSIRFYGEVAALPLKPIASHLMAGALKAKAGSQADVDLVNMVNAISVAREKGVELELIQKDSPLANLTNLIACDFKSENGMVHLSGTVYAHGIYRLVEYQDFNVDAEISNKMLIIENEDVPGIIGKIGTLLGEQGINISQMSCGRTKDTRNAVNIFAYEGEISNDLISQLTSISGIRSAVKVQI